MEQKKSLICPRKGFIKLRVKNQLRLPPKQGVASIAGETETGHVDEAASRVANVSLLMGKYPPPLAGSLQARGGDKGMIFIDAGSFLTASCTAGFLTRQNGGFFLFKRRRGF